MQRKEAGSQKQLELRLKEKSWVLILTQCKLKQVPVWQINVRLRVGFAGSVGASSSTSPLSPSPSPTSPCPWLYLTHLRRIAKAGEQSLMRTGLATEELFLW